MITGGIRSRPMTFSEDVSDAEQLFSVTQFWAGSMNRGPRHQHTAMTQPFRLHQTGITERHIMTELPKTITVEGLIEDGPLHWATSNK
jgi:hypothetical protein